MAKKPKLEIRQYHGEGRYDYALFRADRSKPICSGISRTHAEHIKIILGRVIELPEIIKPIKDWYMYDEIVDVDSNGYGKPRRE